MKSRRGMAGAILVLLAVPVAVVAGIVAGLDGAAVHFMLGAGFILLGLSAFDFQTPRWVQWYGAVASIALSTVLLLQGLTDLTRSDALFLVAYDLLGQYAESALSYAFVLWCFAVALYDSRGTSRVFGIVVLTIALIASIYLQAVRFAGGTGPEALKLTFLLVFVWLLVESRKAAASRLRAAENPA